MKKSVLIVLAVILAFTGIFTGISIWQYNRDLAAFPADGYVLAGEAEAGVVSCDYFSAGTKYSRNYAENMVFRTSLGTDAKVDQTSFIHYTDGSLSSFSTGIVLDVEKLHSGTRDSYFLEGGMVLTKESSGYSIDNNGNTLEFQDILWMIDDMKFLVGADNMVLTLPSGGTQDLSGYVEVTYVDENVVQICNEEQIWQTVPTGTKITLSNGEVIDLGTRDITGTDGTVYGNLNDILADLSTGGGVAVASNSAMDWKPPTFEFEAIDGQDGEAGEDGEAGIDGVAGEAGIDGENGVDGTNGSNGASGSNGANGSDGVSGANGTSGAGGSAGSNGEGGSAGASAAAGAAGSTEANGALAKVLISDLKYDCASLDITFYADGDADTLVYGTAYVKVLETKTNQEVARIDYNNWEMDLPSTSSGSPVTVHATGLHADTEYTVQIYSGYKVGNAEQGTKAFASRTFYTSGDGVEMSFGTISQDQVTIHLNRQNYSTIRSGKLCLSFEDVDSSGNSKITRVWSDAFALTGSTDVTISLLSEDGESYIENLKSDIPFTVSLFTSEGELAAGNSDGRWEVENDDSASEPAGVAAGSVVKSAQELSGRTLKVTPEYGTLLIYESAKGCYQISVNGIVDPDGAIQSYNYKIYAYEDDGSKKLVKQLYSATNAPVELYVDEDSIQYNKEYYVECVINYNDNEKPYSILVTEGNNPFKTGSGQAVVSYVAGDVVNSSRYNQTTTTGPSFLYGNLKVDTNEAGFNLDLGQTGNVTNIRVDVTSGSDYSQSLTYDSWDSVLRSQVDSDAAKLTKATYVTDDKILYLPVDLWGLKEGSPYTFTVYAYVKYSDATSAYKYVGSGLAVTTEYGSTTYAMDKNGTKVSRSLKFKLESLTGRKVDESDMSANAETYDDKFAVGISLENNWTDKYPLEVTSARALEVKVSPLNLDGSESGSTIVKYVDLYQEKSGVVDSATGEAKDPYVWLSQDKTVNPMVEYLKNDQEPYLYVFDTDDLGSVSAYTKLKVEVSAVYDYTYNASYGFKEEALCNVSGYANEIDFESDTLNMDISGNNKPSLADQKYYTNRDEAVNVSPIKNTGNSGSDYTPITDVLGSGSQDPALASDTIRGYRLEADFQSGTMATVTYYAFTFDDWVAFGKAKSGDQAEALQQYDDIMKAAEADVESWKDKVTAVTITINPDEYDGTTAPPLYLIYTDDAAKASEGTAAVYDAGKGCYLYYTNALKRGQTYLFSFSETDRCVTDENLTPKYTFPYDDILYGHNNEKILRCKPQMMDRQAPEVQMTLNYTDADGKQTWNFTAYDPDQALGRVDGDGKLNGWEELVHSLAGNAANNTKWGLGYILAGTETNLSVYASTGCVPYGTTEEANTHGFATINMNGSSIHPMTLAELDAAYKYSQGTGDHVQKITSTDDTAATKAGIAWKGTFSLENGNSMASIGSSIAHYIYLGRRLNDSAYVTNSTEADSAYDKGAGYDLKTMPSLQYMAAASSVYETVYGSDAFANAGNFSLKATQVGNSIRFSLGSGSEEGRISGLEVTVWQKDTDEKFKKLGTKNISYTPSAQTTDGVVASFSVSESFNNALANAETLMQVRTIYDTGMYGSTQYNLQETGNVKRWNLNTDETSWLVRQQGAAAWYTDVTTASDQSRRYKLAGNTSKPSSTYIWYSQDSDSSATGDNTMSWKLGQRALTTNNYHYTGTFPVMLDNTISTGTGYVKGDAFNSLAASGWKDEETKQNVVLGVLGIANTPMTVENGTSLGIKNNETTLDDILYPANTLLSFITPESQIEFNTTETAPGISSSGIKLGMGQSVLKKMNPDEREYEYYPYLFLELYENTEATTSSAAMYQEDNKSYWVNKNHMGTLLTDPKYFGDDATVGLAAESGTLIKGAEGNTVLGGIPAIKLDLSGNLSGGLKTNIVLKNLLSGQANTNAGSGQNYSIRVYVLPVKDSSAQEIDYTNLKAEELNRLKCYVKDTSGAKGRNYTYYDSARTDYNNWFRILTRTTEAFTGGQSATYTANGYTDKRVTVAYNLKYNLQYDDNSVQPMEVTYPTSSGTSTRTMPEAYIEYRLVDGTGTVVMNHDDIMKASGYTAVTATASRYDETTGKKLADTKVVVYTNSNGIYIPNSTNSRLVITQMNQLLQTKIEAGETYKLQARICYVNPSLKDNGCEEAADQWNPKAKEAGVKTLVPSGTGAKEASIDLKVPTGTDPVQTIATDYTKNTTQQGLDMKVNLRVTDNIYYNVSTWENGKTAPTNAKVYVKIYDRTDGVTEVTDKFRYNNNNQALKGSDGTYQLIPTNSTVTLTWTGNTDYEHRYEVQIWGTTNSVKHTTDADAEGNVLLASSENDNMLKSFLTMPGTSGIDFKSTSLTYSKANSKLELKVLAGSGYSDLTGAVLVTINGENNRTASYASDGLTWSGNSCSITLSATEANKISQAGQYTATFVFTTKDGNTKYTYTQYFTVVK